jgi:hypothetical protein
MINVTIYEDGGEQRFAVHQMDDDGSNAVDVTEHFEVHALVVEDPKGQIGGYHIGRRLLSEDVLSVSEPCAHISTTLRDENGDATCFLCGALVRRQGREL